MSPARPPTHTNSAPRRFHDACGDGVQPPALKAIEQPELDLGSDVGVRPPARVLADIAHTRVPVLWMGDTVEQLFAAQTHGHPQLPIAAPTPWTCRSSTTAVSAYYGAPA